MRSFSTKNQEFKCINIYCIFLQIIGITEKDTLTTAPAKKVRIIITRIIIVATIRVDANIFLNWLNGPTRKQVLQCRRIKNTIEYTILKKMKQIIYNV